MKSNPLLSLGVLALLVAIGIQPALAQAPPGIKQSEDWLLNDSGIPAKAQKLNNEIVFSNGLVSRTFRTEPNAATIELDNLITNESLVRSVKPEMRIQLDGTWYDVGGLSGQPNHAYLLPDWLDAMTADPDAFQFVDHDTGPIEAHLEWKQRRYAGNTTWPAAGQTLTLWFDPPASADLSGLRIGVHYNLYEGLPLMAKWFTLRNRTNGPVKINRFISEVLAVVEAESVVERNHTWRLPRLHVQSDYTFGGTPQETTHWVPDTTYTTQVNYRLETPALLESRPKIGPDVTVAAGETFTSFRTYELLFDSDDRERQGLSIRKMYRTIAPWVTENPIMMHVREADSASVRLAIDQAAEVGFEMVIMTFGSGVDMENTDPDYIRQIKELVDYAHSKDIELGAYSLLASRRISDEHDVINPETGTTGGAIFNNSPCLASAWGENYFDTIQNFLAETGMDILEHDGNYPGDVCASTTHPHHTGLEDSQWIQWKKITDFYAWSLANGVYLNVPDYYHLNGSTKSAMGYRETNWSLPRSMQIMHARQNIYDGTWDKTPSMGWMFVPLVEYHGGGEAATMEPLSEHLNTYGAQMANLFGAGVMAAYRGPRLYDTEETRDVVAGWVAFYKSHREILDSDIIHLRRADGKDYDGFMHVNPQGEEKALVMLYNPTDEVIEREITLPLYYAGLGYRAQISSDGGPYVTYNLGRDNSARVQIRIEPGSYSWLSVTG